MTEGRYIRNRLIFVAIIAILIRFGFILWDSSGYYIKPQWNLSKAYFVEGYGIAAGYGYVEGESVAGKHLKALYRRVNSENIRVTPEVAGVLPEEGKYFKMNHPPGMALLVAGINRLFGIRADLPVQILGLILDSTAAVLVSLIVTNFLNFRVGFISGLLYALFPPLAYMSSVSRLPEGLLSFFIVANLACILQGSRSKGLRAIAWYVFSGLFLGLGSYLRPDYTLLPLFMFPLLWIHTRRFIRSFSTIVAVQIVVLMLLIPWAYRNYKLCDRWIFTSTAVGATLITGLGEFTNPWGFVYSDEARYKEAVSEGYINAWSPDADLYFRKLFIKCVYQNPTEFLRIIILRLPMAILTPYDWGYNNPYVKESFVEASQSGKDRYQILKSETCYFLRAYWDRLLMAGLSFLSLIGTFILVIQERSRFGLVLLVLSPHIYSISSHLITHLESRYIIPSVFCWLIGLAYLLDRVLPKADTY